MLTIGFPAAAFATNCFILAPGEGEECIVVDPGIGVAETVAEIVAEHRLKPVAVLLTHGHVDHVWSVTPVCGGTAGAYIHVDDRYRLVNPMDQVDPELRFMLEQQFGRAATWREPEHVVTVTDQAELEVAGLTLTVLHAPGHTEGSAMFRMPEVPDGVNAEVSSTLVGGDVLFAGSIGRCDLPGGSEAAMNRSLKNVVLPLPDDTLVLTGHGPMTTIGRERHTNPFLRGL